MKTPLKLSLSVGSALFGCAVLLLGANAEAASCGTKTAVCLRMKAKQTQQQSSKAKESVVQISELSRPVTNNKTAMQLRMRQQAANRRAQTQTAASETATSSRCKTKLAVCQLQVARAGDSNEL